MKSKLVIFLVNGIAVEQIEGSDIDICGVESVKSAIAASKGINYDDIEIETKDIEVPEIPEITGNWIVRGDGLLMAKAPNQYASFIPANGLRPAMDINKEELEEEFLELISKKDFVNAITFS